MADRPSHLPGYPMPPNNFMNLAQQHQQSPMAYQPSQGSMNPAQQIPGVPNPEYQRLWQQYQNRHRAMGGADGMGAQQMNPQMAELLRNQAALGQTQNQQQQQQQQQSPPQLQQAHQFSNLGGLTQMNNGMSGQNHLLAMQRQQGMQGGAMGSISGTQLTPQMVQMLAAQRNSGTNPAMVQMDRQLRLLNKAQTQQPQNSPANFGQAGPSFSGHPNLGQLPFATNVFPPKSNEGRVPVPQGQQQFPPTGMSNGGMTVHGFSNETMQQILRTSDGRPLTVEEIGGKASQLRRAIDHEKKMLSELPKPSSPEAVMAFKERVRDIQNKEFILSRMDGHMKNLMSQQSQQAGPSSANDGQAQEGLNSMGFPNASQQQSGQQQLQPNPNWMPHMNNGNLPPNQLPGNGLLANQQMVNGVSQNGQNQLPHQQINTPFHPNLVQSQQQTPGPPSGSTPQQQQMLQALLHQNGGHSSPPSAGSTSLSGQGSLGQQVTPHEGQDAQHRPNMSFPPIARDRFGAMLQDWWKRNGIKPDPRMIMIGNRQIDIHQLHTEVLQFGGVVNVKRHGLWNVIAAKMGWTPATISEAGQTQDQIVEQFKTVYEQLLESFEMSYMQAAMKQSLTAPPQQTAGQQGDSSRPGIELNQSPAPSQQLSTQQAFNMMKLANMSTEQLRSGGYPENLVQHIEQTRPALLAAWRKMQVQRAQASQQQQQQQQQALHQPQGGVLNPPISFQNQPQGQTALHRSSPFQPQVGGIPNANAPNNPGFSGGTGETSVQQQRPPLTVQNLTPQNVQMLNILQNLQRPTPETIKQSASMVDQMKQEISKERGFRAEHVKHLADADKATFPGQFNHFCNIVKDIARLLHMYLAATNDKQLVRGILTMYDMCDKQRQLLQGPNHVYVLDIAALQRLTRSAMEYRTKVFLVVQQVRIMMQGDQNQNRHPLQQQNDGGLPPSQHGLSPQHVASSPASAPPRPPTVQPPPPQVHQQNLRVPHTETPQMVPARPPSVVRQKGLVASSPNTAESAPSPSASTPLPAAATPSHLQASPHTPKSPKAKTAPKPRPRQRRVSKAIPPNANVTPATPTAAASTPAVATSASAPSAVEPARSPAQRAPSPAEKNSLKRPRDDEPSAQSAPLFTSGSASEETPSKRMKNDWETVPENQPSKRQVEVERIKTPGQAAQFYNDMTQILELSNNSALPPDLQETLAQLVKTVGPGLDIPDGAGSSSLSNLTSTGTTSPKGADGDDSFFSFLDFTAFQQDDDKAAADTPELVPTSSTNPSPESGAGSETDHPFASASSGSTGDKAKIVDTSEAEPKADFFDNGSDPLRLGIWGEIDGGESGYFNSSDVWRWDSGPNSSGDNSWAIST